ncbi:ATP-dependent DNA ligase Cdc17 [Coemansia sp. RSA 552]|nr:ATP-dependent DNA ligase Cdc17 [Coemansia sp. RSA 552]
MKQGSLSSFFSGGGMARDKSTASTVPAKEAPQKDSKTEDSGTDTELGSVKAEAEPQKTSESGSLAAAAGNGARRGAKRRLAVSEDSDSSSDATGLSDAEAKAEEDGPGSESSSDEDGVSKAATKVSKKLTLKTQKKPTAKRAKAGGAAKVTVPTFTMELLDTKDGKQVPFLALCRVFEAMEATTKRLEITALAKDLLYQVMQVDQEQLAHTVMLCMGKIAPDHEGIELGVGDSFLMKAVATAIGRQVAKVKQDRHELGDLGMVAQRGKANQRSMFKPKPLSVSKVFRTFREIATTSGASSQQKKVGQITGLLGSCTGVEAKYLIRSLEGKLRIGLAESTVQTALAQAALVYEEGGREDLEPEDFQKATENLKQVLSEFPIYETIIESLYKHGVSDIANYCMLTPTLPVKPMLAKIEKAADDILRRFEDRPFTCEYKYDGERSQIHYVREEDGTEKCVIFSRNAEDNTLKYPDIARAVKEFAKPDVTSFILDCEAVAWDKDSGKIRSFQTLSSRKKKVDDESSITVAVCCFAFDLLFLNGERLQVDAQIRKPLRARRELLRQHFVPVKDKFCFAISKDLTKVEDIQEFLEASVEDNCEGLMIKTLDGDMSAYEPSKRSMNWLKLKKDYVDGLGDSLDLVVIGAYYGRGKRVGTYGSYLLACYDPDREEYQSICNIGTGFSDADRGEHKGQLDKSIIEAPKSYYAISDKSIPDVWFEPVQVWEVKAADLSLSTTYRAALGQIDASKGVSLRFPRFIRIRDDKSPEMATSSTQVAEMYENQKINH